MSVIGVNNYKNSLIESLYLPIGADERLSRKPRSIDKKYSIASISGDWCMSHLLPSRRGVLIDKIHEHFNGRRSECFLTNQIPYLDQADIYASAKMGWNFSPCGFSVINFRVWEVMCSGSCLLTNENSATQLRNLGFIDGLDFVSYPDNNEKQMLEIIDWLLANDDHREQMALNGYNKTMRSHTMRHRMSVLLQCVQFYKEERGIK